MGSGDWTCAMPEHWLFEGTGMKKGDSIKGLIGWEWHGAPAMDLPGMNIVARGDATIHGRTVGQYSQVKAVGVAAGTLILVEQPE